MCICICGCVCAHVCVYLCIVTYGHCLEYKVIYPSIYLFIYCAGLKDLEGFDISGRRGENLRICSIYIKESGLTPLCRMKMEVGAAVKIDLNEGTVSSLMLAPGLSLTGVGTLPQNHGMRARSNAPTFRFRASSLLGSSLQKIAGIKNSLSPLTDYYMHWKNT